MRVLLEISLSNCVFVLFFDIKFHSGSHTCNLSILGGAKAGGLLQIQGQIRLEGKTLSQEQKKPSVKMLKMKMYKIYSKVDLKCHLLTLKATLRNLL